MKKKHEALGLKTLPRISKQNFKPSRLQRIGDSPFPGITLRQILCNHTGEIEEIAWSPNGLMFASVAADNTICIFDNSNWQLLKKLQRARSGHALSWSPDNLKLATGRWEKIQVWDVIASKIKSELVGHTDVVFSIAWDPTGKKIASGSQDNTVRV